MTDIVERLKRVGAERQRTTAHDDPDHYLHVVAKISNADGQMMLEAADEIERLRDVLKNVQHSRVLQGKAISDAAAEIERLRAALLTGVCMLSEMGLDPREKCEMAYDYMSAALEGK